MPARWRMRSGSAGGALQGLGKDRIGAQQIDMFRGELETAATEAATVEFTFGALSLINQSVMEPCLER